MNLTIDQLAKCVFKTRHESRRQAKRYLKDHGGNGRAEELDAVLATITPEVEAQVAAMVAARDARAATIAADAARMKPREELAQKARIAAAALQSDWGWIGLHVEPSGDASCWSEDRLAAVLAWGTSTPEMLAAELQRRDDEREFDSVFEGEDVAEIAAEIVSAVELADRDVYVRTAEENLRAEAKPGARWAVIPYYRKTLAPDRSFEALEFEDRDTARAYLLIAHDPEQNRTSSYSVALVDSGEDEDGSDDDESADESA